MKLYTHIFLVTNLNNYVLQAAASNIKLFFSIFFFFLFFILFCFFQQVLSAQIELTHVTIKPPQKSKQTKTPTKQKQNRPRTNVSITGCSCIYPNIPVKTFITYQSQVTFFISTQPVYAIKMIPKINETKTSHLQKVNTS